MFPMVTSSAPSVTSPPTVSAPVVLNVTGSRNVKAFVAMAPVWLSLPMVMLLKPSAKFVVKYEAGSASVPVAPAIPAFQKRARFATAPSHTWPTPWKNQSAK